MRGCGKMPAWIPAPRLPRTWPSTRGCPMPTATDHGTYVALLRDDGLTVTLSAAEARAVADAISVRSRVNGVVAHHLERHAVMPAAE